MSENPFTVEQLISHVEQLTPDGSPMQQLTTAILTSGTVAEVADEMVGHFVENARAAGHSWAEIGEAMGTTRQAAQQRFTRPRGRGGAARGMFARFAYPAREVVMRAVAHAHEFGDDHVGTEHLVLGLIEDPESRAARAVEACDSDLSGIWSAVGSTPAEEVRTRRGHIPFAPDAKKTLQLALREALRLGSRRIEAEHILLGILRDERTPGAVILASAGVTRAGVEAWLRANPGPEGTKQSI